MGGSDKYPYFYLILIVFFLVILKHIFSFRFLLSYSLTFDIVIFITIYFSNILTLPGSGHIDTAIWVYYMDSNKTAREEARRQLHKNAAYNLEQVLAATPQKTPTVRPPASYHENYSS